METLGQILKTAREKKKVTASQAATVTRIKIQHIEAMERDDFSRIPAPTYGRGFIKLYAEYLGLAPAPLIEMYLAQQAPKEDQPSIKPKAKPQAPKKVLREEPAPQEETTKPAVRQKLEKGRPAIIGAGVVILVIVLLSLSFCGRSKPADHKPAPVQPAPQAQKGSWAVIQEPPEPYINPQTTPTTP